MNPNSQPLLILDCRYLCHRAFHSQGRELTWKGVATGVIFGFLKSISLLKDQFRTDQIAFCFEGPSLKRKAIYPDYKAKRNKDLTIEEQESYRLLSEQIDKLEKHYLPKIGFRNIFRYPGMESDDVIAALAADYDQQEKDAILVTADSDMFQCLTNNVAMFSPHKNRVFTFGWFLKQYKIRPKQWAVVKAIAGCVSDNVKGIKGVGEVTALRFVRQELEPTSKPYQSIMCKEGKAIVRRNKRLVKLPFDGCPTPKVRPDEISMTGWKEVCAELGMRSLAGHPPVLTRIMGKVK